MKTRFAPVLALSLALAAPMAQASSTLGLNAETKAQITQKLTEQGYEMGKIKVEKGMYEVYARKDGKKTEVLLDAQLNFVRTEMDD